MKNVANLKKILLVFYVFTACMVFSDFNDNNKEYDEYCGYGISGKPDYIDLLDKPVRILKEYNKTDGKRFSIISDYHMLIPCSVSELAELLSNLDSSEDVFPRMALSEVYYHAKFPRDIYYQKVITDFETLGFGREYEYTMKVYFDENSDTRFKMRWTLNESVDNTFSVFEGSWYCEEVIFQDKKYTYLRNFTETEFIDPGFITVFAVKHFSEGEIRKAFKSIKTAIQ